MKVQEVKLSDISPSKNNFRKTFFGPEYDALMESVRKNRVQVPIKIRPVEGRKTPFEIVYGERRWRVSCDLARENGGITKHAIPAIVEKMTDEEAYDATQIENLHRTDIPPLEQAKGYQAFLKRNKSADAILDLATRLGIDHRQIRRTVAILDLDAEILEAWDTGKITLGHLEVLRTLPEGDHKGTCRTIIERGYSVYALKQIIAKSSVTLKRAYFDTAECAACPNNTDATIALFGGDIAEKGMCRDLKCFKVKQIQGITENLADFKKKHKLTTNAVVVEGDLGWNDFESFHAAAPKSCKDCANLKTIVTLDGKPLRNNVCTGDKGCYRNATSPKGQKKAAAAGKSKGDGGEPEETAVRVEWHGECFREIFYSEILPKRIQDASLDQLYKLALMSLALTDNNVAREIRGGGNGTPYIQRGSLFAHFKDLSAEEMVQKLRDAVTLTILRNKEAAPDIRSQIAEFLGIDLKAEWAMTKEYLLKKTAKELRKIIVQFKLYEIPEIAANCPKYGTTATLEGLASLKKSSLVELIADSGANLTGLVPDEILAFSDREDFRFRYKKLFDHTIVGMQAPANDGGAGDGLDGDPEEE